MAQVVILTKITGWSLSDCLDMTEADLAEWLQLANEVNERINAEH